ncbi:hypothetical protein TNCV_1696801 [Trichonephila clavipes]|nr:hypothetical protein TNCV_1696801 [Trichonephila clavipes]
MSFIAFHNLVIILWIAVHREDRTFERRICTSEAFIALDESKLNFSGPNGQQRVHSVDDEEYSTNRALRLE